MYTSLYLVSKLIFGGKKKTPEIAAASGTVAITSESIPAVDSEQFGSWIGEGSNVDKWIESVEKM